jgi:hypothetical protein
MIGGPLTISSLVKNKDLYFLQNLFKIIIHSKFSKIEAVVLYVLLIRGKHAQVLSQSAKSG